MRTYQIRPSEAVQQSYFFLLVRHNPPILDLLLNDQILMVDIIATDSSIYPLESLLPFLVITSSTVESRRLRDKDEDNSGKTDESPHGVNGVSPFTNGQFRDDL
jgi:hypothetical protein